MPLSSDDLAVVRSWVGSGPTDGALQARHARLESVDLVVEEELRSQLKDLTDRPASFTLPEGYSQSTAANISALQDQLKRFRQTGTGLTSRTARLTRVGRPTR